MPVPKEEDWRAIAEEFKEKWNFLCLGSINGKHMVIQAPPCSGSQFYNYKGTYSIVLLALVDANYWFRVIDIGANGRASDGGTLRESAFGRALQDGTLGIPPPATLPVADHLGPVLYVFVGNKAFPLKPNLMRLYAGPQDPGSPQRIFNYQLSRARLVVEYTFGTFSALWRMYRQVLTLKPENTEVCVKATRVLHNFLRTSQGSLRSQRSTRTDVGVPSGGL
ncbi:uncharacterized protein LOC121534891 [Coregonus clupeaformis]|uniref:uncharacterized protein LOC121534891 n=1 Tax=Coregonus clupeaformis TaxID=59861 RepID=UPI001BE11971|nr:uncharacterized protein LOC121534891 [Coregonus clupeaformis]